MATAPSQPQTLATLEPDWPWQVQVAQLRMSHRHQGSWMQLIRKASRAPDVHRAYHHGDPVQRIDWRVYGRSDELVVRDVRDEANMRVLLLLDQQPSMIWPNEAVLAAQSRRIPTKYEWALRVCLHLAYAHLHAGDEVQIALFEGDDFVRTWQPRQRDIIAQVYAALKSDGFLPQTFAQLIPDVSSQSLGALHQANHMQYVMSDMLSQSTAVDWERSVLLHTLSSLERNLDWIRDEVSYFDEVDHVVEFPGRFMRSDVRYNERIAQWVLGLTTKIERAGGSYIAINDAMPVPALHAAITHLFSGRL